MRTEAPKDFAGRGWANFARTTPELPIPLSAKAQSISVCLESHEHTVRAGDLAPDHTDLGPANLLLSPVDVRDLLAKVEAYSRVSRCPEAQVECPTYLAALVSSTPSILIKLVWGVLVRRPRW